MFLQKNQHLENHGHLFTHELGRHGSNFVTQRRIILHDTLLNQVVELEAMSGRDFCDR